MYNLYCINYTVKCYDIFIVIKSPLVEFRNEIRRNHRDHFQVHHLQVKYWKSGQNQNQMVPSMLKTQNAMTSWNHIWILFRELKTFKPFDQDEFQFRWWETRIIEIENPTSKPLISNLLKWNWSSSYTIKIFEKIYEVSDCFNKDFPYLSAVDLILDYAFLFD